MTQGEGGFVTYVPISRFTAVGQNIFRRVGINPIDSNRDIKSAKLSLFPTLSSLRGRRTSGLKLFYASFIRECVLTVEDGVR